MDNQNNKDRQRLENLIAGNTRGYRLSDSELPPLFQKQEKHTADYTGGGVGASFRVLCLS